MLKDLQLATNAMRNTNTSSFANMSLANISRQAFQLRGLLCGRPDQTASQAAQSANAMLNQASTSEGTKSDQTKKC